MSIEKAGLIIFASWMIFLCRATRYSEQYIFFFYLKTYYNNNNEEILSKTIS